MCQKRFVEIAKISRGIVSKKGVTGAAAMGDPGVARELPGCGSEKPALRAGRGLTSRCPGRKSQETTPARHELEPKWEIPVEHGV
jgi:hypothetical protein